MRRSRTCSSRLPPSELNRRRREISAHVADRKVYNIVQLIYRSKHYEGHSKDYEFSRLSMQDHWEAGYNDAVRTLAPSGSVGAARPTVPACGTFDLGVDGRE